MEESIKSSRNSTLALFCMLILWTNVTFSSVPRIVSLNGYESSKPKMCFSTSGLLRTENLNAAAIQPIANGIWYESRIWPNGKLPTATEDVVIPAGRTVTLAGTCRAKTILVNGKLNAVNWQAGGAWINLETEGILVSGTSAVLEIGTETQPYFADGKCTITLKGAKVMNASGTYKGILVQNGGTLDLHGKKKMSWTNLSATANIGAKSITLKQAVDWEIGDVIVLTSTALADKATNSWENVDQVEIQAISTDKKTITLKTALKFKHIGGSKSYTRAKDGKKWNVDIFGEVGLLSHYIKIQSDIEETDVVGFGGHIMVMKNTTARVENVELYKMGQKGVLGRYPFHWHLGENTAVGDYFRNSSVHKSFNRAVTIHGTDYVTVDGIFAYDHIGHGLFLEDGGERFNTIKNNVVFVTRRPAKGEELTPSDNESNEAQNRTPSSYWITNATNYFENNVAAGTEGTGFWLALPEGKPMFETGNIPYFQDVNPVTSVLGKFDGFVVHTCMNGWDIFDRLNPDHSLKKNFGWDVNTNQYLDKGLFYGNETALYCGLGVNSDQTKVVFRDCIFSDNKIGTMLAGDLTIENSLINSDSDLDVFTGNREFLRYYDGPGRHHNCHFQGWDRANAQIIMQITGGGATENFNPSFRNTTVSSPIPFRFFPLPNTDDTRARKVGQFLKDYDGGLTGKAHTTIVRDIPFLTDGHEYRHASWRNAARSDYYFASLWMAAINGSGVRISVERTKAGTPDACFYEPGYPESGTYKFPMIVNEGFLYTYSFNQAPSNKSIHLIWNRGDNGDMGLACFKGLGKLGNFRVNGHQFTIPKLNSKTAVENSTSSAYFIDINGDVYIKFKSVSNKPDDRVNIFLNWDSNGTFQPGTLACTTNNLTGLSALDSDGDGMSDIEEVEVCRLPNDAGDLNFEFNMTDEGFTKVNIAADNKGSNVAWLIRADKSNDPYIVKEGFKFKGSEVPQLKIRAKSEATGAFQLFWTTTDDAGFTAAKSVTVIPNTTNTYQEMVFDMSSKTGWMGKSITKLRIDFPPDINNNRHAWIDYIHGPDATNKGCVVTEIEEIVETESSLFVFPNPSQDGVFQLSMATNWKVYSVLGNELKSGNSNQIDLSENAKGVYLIKMKDKIQRVVKE
jgi:hypothetical protein